jgi:16S rRNA (adenine1518-N6/adenine1519-N6)-dimethyltransferase
MQPIASAQTTRCLLRELKVSPNKLLGQNFLISGSVAEKITAAAGINDGGGVLEIGAGLGALSEQLAAGAGFLTLIELDGRLHTHLRCLFAGRERVEVIQADALSFDYAAYAAARNWREYLLVANLPYSITSPLIQRLLLRGGSWRSLTLMTQYEAAIKLLPAPNAGTNGPLSLLAQYFGTACLLFTVPKECFFPAPQVESAVIQLMRHAQPPFVLADTERFARFLSAAFSHRRKTLTNSLNGCLGGGADFWRQALRCCGVGENKRAEQLALPDYAALYALPQVQEYLP